MRILFIGDIVGRSGRTAVTERLPGLIRDWKLDFVAINGENAAGGFGITEAIYQEFIDAGADAITGGNHSWDQREALVFIERAPKLLRPINFPPGTPGRGVALIDAQQRRARAGRQRHGPRSSWTRSTIRSRRSSASLRPVRSSSGADAIVVDIHCRGDQREAGDGPFLRRPREPRGRHPYACADRRPPDPAGGTAFISDVGMTGDYDSVIGMAKDEPLNRFLRKIPGGRVRAGAGRGDAVRARGRDRRRDRARPARRGGAARRPAGAGAAGVLGVGWF